MLDDCAAPVNEMGRPPTTYRVASRHKPFAQLGNAMLRDQTISLQARGLLGFVLSYPSDWTFNKKWLVKETGAGRDRVDTILQELDRARYCKRRQDRNVDGTMGPWEYVFTDEPEPQPEKPVAVDEPQPGKPQPAEPRPANPQQKNIYRARRLKRKNTERGALARLPAHQLAPANGKLKKTTR